MRLNLDYKLISCLTLLLISLLLMSETVYPADTYEEEEEEEEIATQRLSNIEVERMLKSGSTEDLRLLFSRLTPEQKTSAFRHLTPEEQSRAFKWLTTEEKQMVFAGIGEQDVVHLFSNLTNAEQELIFKGLEDQFKVQILSAMPDVQRQRWLERYPGLEMLLQDKTALHPQATKVLQPKTQEPVKKRPSRIEKIMSGSFPQSIERELKQFGYDFFNTTLDGYGPLTNVPVGDDYVLGPGDSFIIHLWGNVENSYTVTVNRDGTIVVPRIGSLTVAELTFTEAKELLKNTFDQYYPEFSMNVTMDRLRSIQVFVIGEIQRPGVYSISGLSTAIDALYAAGGVSKNGSLRNIKITRNAETIATLDMYTFLIGGLKESDIRLRTGDTVFVPVIGAVTGIAGNVRRPAIYEIKGATTIRQLLDLSGGVMPTGYLQSVVVERIADNQRRIVKSFNLDSTQTGNSDQMETLLADGDVVKVFPVHKQMRQVVFLEGHVKYPREYEYRPGMRVGDLIPSYDTLLPEPFLPRAEIIRSSPPDLHTEIIEFKLGALLEGESSQNIELQDMDRIIVYSVAEKMNMPIVKINGAVRRPGIYRLYSGMRVKDLIFRADNLLPSAHMDNASLARIAIGRDYTDLVTIDFSPSKAIAGIESDDMELKPSDSVYIREMPRYNEVLERKVSLEGEFKFPGEYTFAEGERVSSLIARAGGVTDHAYLFGSMYFRKDVRKLQEQHINEYISGLEEDILTLTSQSAETSMEQEEAAIILKSLTAKKQLLEKMKTSQPTGRMVVDLAKVIEQPGSDSDLVLQAGDRIVVKKRPDYVNVLGEVYNPTALLVTENRSVGYYLNQVGGANENADDDQIYLVKANGTVVSKSQEGFWGIATWDSDNHRWALGGFENIHVSAGDTIIVPKKVEKYPWLRVVKGITEITFQIAVTAGVLIAAF